MTNYAVQYTILPNFFFTLFRLYQDFYIIYHRLVQYSTALNF